MIEHGPMTTNISHNGLKYLVSTADTFDNGPETMVFSVLPERVDFLDIYCKHHDNMQDAWAFHQDVVNNWANHFPNFYNKHASLRDGEP